MEQDRREEVRELEEAWAGVAAVAERWAATVQVQARAVNVSAHSVEHRPPTRQAFPAIR